jgi:2-polyprenyl-6-methoxyphenol hydroxylase-like FAD-dependent oxidoreductase
MKRGKEHAIVLGAGMGGLLAARVLADTYDRVTVIERDRLSRAPSHRRGLPQGRHVHGLQPGGARVVDELFPGLLDELVDWGATLLDDYSRFYFLPDGVHRVSPDLRTEAIYQPSRPFLENGIRARVRETANVAIADNRDIVGLMSDGVRVTGVRVATQGAPEQVLMADLVVDASGRGSRTPVWLAELGYGRPDEEEVVIDVRYTSTLVRLAPGAVRETLTVIGPTDERSGGMSMAAYEDGTWMFTVFGYGDGYQGLDYAGMVEFVAGFAPEHMVAALRAAEPVDDVATFRFRANRRRRYDRMHRFPRGLLVLGDALCAFNPIYGQGMAVAALEARVLRDCLRGGEENLARRFFRKAAKPIQIAWDMAVGADLALPYVSGSRPLQMRLVSSYVGRVLVAAQHDPVVAARFMQVSALTEKPPRLMTPPMLARVVAANLRARRLAPTGPAPQPEPSAVGG